MKEKFLLTLASLAVVVFAVPADASFAVVLGSNGVYAYADKAYTHVEKIKQMAIDLCQKHGGVNIRVVGAGSQNGWNRYCRCAIAGSGHGEGGILGVGLCASSETEADSEALQDCRAKGGANPKIVAGWRSRPVQGSGRL
jgi:hypothetical protein